MNCKWALWSAHGAETAGARPNGFWRGAPRRHLLNTPSEALPVRDVSREHAPSWPEKENTARMYIYSEVKLRHDYNTQWAALVCCSAVVSFIPAQCQGEAFLL